MLVSWQEAAIDVPAIAFVIFLWQAQRQRQSAPTAAHGCRRWRQLRPHRLCPAISMACARLLEAGIQQPCDVWVPFMCYPTQTHCCHRMEMELKSILSELHLHQQSLDAGF